MEKNYFILSFGGKKLQINNKSLISALKKSFKLNTTCNVLNYNLWTLMNVLERSRFSKVHKCSHTFTNVHRRS